MMGAVDNDDAVVEAKCGCWWPRGERCVNCSSCSACCRCIAMQLAAAQLCVVQPGAGDLELDVAGVEVSHAVQLQRHAILAAGYDAAIERWARRATERLRRSCEECGRWNYHLRACSRRRSS